MPRAPGQAASRIRLIGNLASLRASLSYVTGAHNMKFGYQGGFSNPSQTYQYFTQVVQVRMSNGVPNQLTQTISVGPRHQVRPQSDPDELLRAGSVDAQPADAAGRRAVRLPDLELSRPGHRRPRLAVRPRPRSSIRAARPPATSWNDITPRLGVAYDLFGNGKTAVKFNLGKYLEAITATNNDLDMNPLIRTAMSTTRGWTDTNRGLRAGLRSHQPGGERRMRRGWTTRTSGSRCSPGPSIPTTSAAGAPVPYNWAMGLSVQQEVVPRVSVNVGYFRNWWGNWYVVDNRATSLADYTPFSIKAPLDPRLPNGGGYTIGGLYNLVPDKVGQVDELAQSSRTSASRRRTGRAWISPSLARLRNGLTVQGGTSTGRRLADGCAVRAKLPELGTGPIPGPTGSRRTAP